MAKMEKHIIFRKVILDQECCKNSQGRKRILCKIDHKRDGKDN